MLIHRTRTFILTIALIIMIVSNASFGDSEASSEDSSSKRIPVTIVKVEMQTVTPVLNYSGTVKAWSRAALGSEIPGRIVTMSCEIGDIVSEGDLLVELGSETLIQARASFDVVKKDFERIKFLCESGSASQQAMDRIQAAYDAAGATYNKVLLSTQIRAPFSGVITSKYLDCGEVYSLFPGPAGSPAILELMDVDSVKVIIAVTESRLKDIMLGQKSSLKLDAYSDLEFSGTVSKIHPTVSSQTRTADVEIKIDNRSGYIKPGMFGIVKLSLPSQKALLVDRDALIKQEGTGIFYVFKVENGKTNRINVDTGELFDGLIQITAGLKSGDNVVTTGKMKVKTGSSVLIVKELSK